MLRIPHCLDIVDYHSYAPVALYSPQTFLFCFLYSVNLRASTSRPGVAELGAAWNEAAMVCDAISALAWTD
jgi:hypothetical protein